MGVLAAHRTRRRNQAISENVAVTRLLATLAGQILKLRQLAAAETRALEPTLRRKCPQCGPGRTASHVLTMAQASRLTMRVLDDPFKGQPSASWIIRVLTLLLFAPMSDKQTYPYSSLMTEKWRPSKSAEIGAAPATAMSHDLFRRIRPIPVYKTISDEVQRLIVSGRLKPGDPLPTEQELSERFGVNRSTVREAIRLIEQEGMLERREGRRLFVCLPGLYDLAPRATRMLMLQQTTFEELWETAITLEPLAARLAAEHAEEDDVARLKANIDATAALTLPEDQPDSELAALVDLDVEFHALVGAASHNRPLMLAREPISLLYKPTLIRIYRSVPQSKSRVLQAHRRIVEGLANANAPMAVEWMHKHLVDFQRGFQMAGMDMKAPIRLFLGE